MTDLATLATQLYAYAEDHYNDNFGWSVIVECWEQSDIIAYLDTSGASNLKEAVKAFGSLVDVWGDKYADAVNSAF